MFGITTNHNLKPPDCIAHCLAEHTTSFSRRICYKIVLDRNNLRFPLHQHEAQHEISQTQGIHNGPHLNQFGYEELQPTPPEPSMMSLDQLQQAIHRMY
jgi:hypothetical protein